FVFFFSSRRRHTRCYRDWSSDVCSSDLVLAVSSDDAIESLAAVQAAQENDLEPRHIHRLALDVLAHQVVGSALDQGGTAPWSDRSEERRVGKECRPMGSRTP